MKIVSTSYTYTPEFNDPLVWLDRINFSTGIWEELSKQHETESIEQINYAGELKRNGVLYHFLNFKKGKQYFPFKLHKYIQQIRPDVVFVNGFIFPLQVIQLGLKLGREVKIIVINHAEKPFTGIKKLLQHYADRYVYRYLFTSKEMGLEWVKKRIIDNESKIAEVMEASSSFHVMKKEKVLARTGVEGEPVFLWVGRLNVNKDPMTVVKAFGEFIKYNPFAKLYMIYHTEELKGAIARFCEKEDDLKNAIKMIGKVAHKEMPYWYNSADFIISGSHYEGSGVAVCEAMSCGCVPVLTSIPSFRKMTGPGICGLLFEAGNEKDLLAALLQTREMDTATERTKTLKQFNEELSFEAIAKKIDYIITSL